MSHVHHASLPGYDPRQVLVDGCGECHLRSLGLPMTMMELDGQHFRDAWLRAFWWQHDDDTSLHLSQAEIPLLKTLWAMQVALERFFNWPVGSLPEAPPASAIGHRAAVARAKGRDGAATGVVEAMVHAAERQAKPQPGCDPERCRHPFGSHAPTCAVSGPITTGQELDEAVDRYFDPSEGI
jgi:hypothetical protein